LRSANAENPDGVSVDCEDNAKNARLPEKKLAKFHIDFAILSCKRLSLRETLQREQGVLESIKPLCRRDGCISGDPFTGVLQVLHSEPMQNDPVLRDNSPS
jgi:hypothetical protein